MDYIIVKRGNGYEEHPIIQSLKMDGILFGKSGKVLVQKKDQVTSMIQPHRWVLSEAGEYLYLSGQEQAYERGAMVSIADQDADIMIEGFPYRLIIENQTMYLSAESTEVSQKHPIYLNKKRILRSGVSIQEGDTIFTEGFRFVLFADRITMMGDFSKCQSRLLEVPVQKETFEGFPVYKRSPRMVKRVDSDPIDLQKVPSKITMGKGSLVQVIVPPLLMMAVTVAVSILMKRGLFILMSVAGTSMSLIFSVVKFTSDRKECKKKEANRVRIYENYLLSRRKKIYQAYLKEKEAYAYNYPSVKEIENMVNNYSSRIYERSSQDDDFLTISVGLERAKTSFSIKTNEDELALEKEELEKEVEAVRNEFQYLDDKPVVIDLKMAHLGLVGEKDLVHEQLKIYLAQLTFAQSYHDLQIITIYNHKYQDDFDWMRWYPHQRIQAFNVFGRINSEKMRDQILGSIHQVIKERAQKQEESKKEGKFLPHYLFIIDEPKLIIDHSIMEYLGRPGSDLGFSIIYTSHLRANLPDNIGTVISLENSRQGRLVLQEKLLMNTSFRLSHVENIGLEQMARNLSVLTHVQGIVSQIPQSITFFEMYQVSRPTELQVKLRWARNESHKSLAVPLGVRAEEDYVYLNLHEKAHGPHGLVAGTTGSGKSEIVQSYILSLAVNFHPHEVGFLLIDYKGGGMAGLFKNLPHLLGTITNLDGSESMRAMASIKSELARRQRVFSANEVNHINAYNKLFKLGKVEEPIPHLFLISDEFAELKKEQPEFMSELVSAARIGRSLGIHLILATQKPSGVVDDQIWTNSKFKLALKVQNEGDSKEILKTPDAANITQAGRAYLQVGNNEIYELFQSAWSGASYNEQEEEETVDDRVYLVNELGQGQLINTDLSGGQESDKIKATQLDVVVDHIWDIYEEENPLPVRRPWLPSLARQIASPHIGMDTIKDVSDCQEQDLTFSLGLVDIPEQQLQKEYQLNLIEDGNLAVYGASGFGKSVALTTIMLSLAVKNSPSLLNYYILDLGNSALVQLKNLPHTADYSTIDDQEKLNKFVNIMIQEMQKRKRLFASVSAMNFDMYNRVADEKLPAVIWFIDNYDVVKEIGMDMETFIAQISRDGAGVGIYTIIAATKPGAVKYTITNNFKNKLALYMFDQSDIHSVVGRTPYKLGEIKGRSLVKLDEVNQMQIYSAVEFTNVIEYTERIRDLIQKMRTAYSGRKPKGIPVLPESLNIAGFKEYLDDESGLTFIPVGLDAEHVVPRGLDLSHNYMIVGGSQSGKTTMLKVILEFKAPQLVTYIIDDKGAELYDYQEKEQVNYVNGIEAFGSFIQDMEALLEQRRAGFEAAKSEMPTLSPRQYYSQLEPILLLIEEWDNFVDLVKELKNPKAEKLIMELESVNVVIVSTTSNGRMRGFDALTKHMKETIYGVILGAPGSQSLFQVPVMRSVKVGTGEGFLYLKGELAKIKIPEV